MHMYKTVGQDMRNRASSESLAHALNAAREEAKADVAIIFSSHLDRLATHAAVNHLSSVEIIELLRKESENLDREGRANKQNFNHG